MPYGIKYVKGDSRPFKIVNLDRNEIVGSSTNRPDAEASIRARNTAEKEKKK